MVDGGIYHLVLVVTLVMLALALITLASSIALALSPSFCWHHCPHCAGIAALVVLALLPLLHCCCRVCGVVYHIIRGLVHASSTRSKTPAY